MVLKFTPRISGKFTELILNQNKVREAISSTPERDRHELVKAILVEGFSKYKIDINELINHIREESETVPFKNY